MKTNQLATISLGVCLLLFAITARGQAPRLAISSPTLVSHQTAHGATHLWQVLLTNHARSAVTAYAITYDGGLPQQGGHGGLRWDDSVPGSAGLHPALPPGGTAPIFLPARGATPPVVENTAVIYADGTTAGDPAVLAHFLKVRAVYLAELPQTISRLQAIAADPGADRAAVLAHFQQQETAEKQSMQDTVLGPRLPRVAGTVVVNLNHSPGSSVQSVASTVSRMLQKLLVQLQQSRPAPEAVTFPAIP